MKHFFYILGIVFTLSVLTPMAFAQTQWQMTKEACDSLNLVELELADNLAKLQQLYAGTPQLTVIEQSQQAWLAYRDAQMNALYPPSQESGSAMPMCRCYAAADMTKKRLADLSPLVDWEEGDVCSPPPPAQ